ncbi:hypothetical protein PoMZ_07493 [Pyricularia oryzae]|uniref:Uncharacterized protein n=1 Tax=Pyricularia oryzae TaxID=318829 RepID=A0A4P7NF98_PYROR|nr:hypothetical protein PoMZ_07493 [Pyricularia oryzae]
MRNPGPCEGTTCAQLLHPSSFLACSQVTSATRTSLDSVDPTRPRQRTQQPVRHCRSVPRATGSEIQNFLFCPFCSDHSLNRSPTKKKEKTRAFATPPHTPPPPPPPPPKEEKKEGPSHAQAATATQQLLAASAPSPSQTRIFPTSRCRLSKSTCDPSTRVTSICRRIELLAPPPHPLKVTHTYHQLPLPVAKLGY